MCNQPRRQLQKQQEKATQKKEGKPLERGKDRRQNNNGKKQKQNTWLVLKERTINCKKKRKQKDSKKKV